MEPLIKDPNADLDYQVDWGAKWLPAGDSITASTWQVTPAGLDIGTGAQAPTHDGTTATVWLSGGMVGQAYAVMNEITTAAGRVNDHTFVVRIRDL